MCKIYTTNFVATNEPSSLLYTQNILQERAWLAILLLRNMSRKRKEKKSIVPYSKVPICRERGSMPYQLLLPHLQSPSSKGIHFFSLTKLLCAILQVPNDSKVGRCPSNFEPNTDFWRINFFYTKLCHQQGRTLSDAIGDCYYSTGNLLPMYNNTHG